MAYKYTVSIEIGYAGEGSGLSLWLKIVYSSLSGSFIVIIPYDKELTLLSPPTLSNKRQVGGMWGMSGLLLSHVKD